MGTMDVPEFEALGQDEQIRRIGLLARRAAGQVGLDVHSMTPLVHAENTTFCIETNMGKYCARVSRPGYQSTANIRSEIAFLAELREAGLPVPRPFRSAVVTTEVPEVPQPRDCVFLAWQEGEFSKGELAPERAYRVGHLMARFHLFSEKWSPPANFTRQRLHAWALDDIPWRELAEGSPMVSRENLELLRRIDDESRPLLKSLELSCASYGLIHADLHQSNVLFDGNETHAIDFDDLGWGFWIFDFAAALAYQVGGSAYEDVREQMLAGYEELRFLPPRTRELLSAFTRMRLMQVCIWVMSRRDNPKIREMGHCWVEEMCRKIRLL